MHTDLTPLKTFCPNFPTERSTMNLVHIPGQNKKHVKVCVRKWMQLLCMWSSASGRCVATQESPSSTTRPTVPPLVTFTQQALLTLVGPTLSDSGSAVPRSHSFQGGKSLLLSTPERSQTEIGDPCCQRPRPRLPKTNLSMRTLLFCKSASAFSCRRVIRGALAS